MSLVSNENVAEEANKETVSYEEMYKLAVQNDYLLAAWKNRLDKIGIGWVTKDIEKLLSKVNLSCYDGTFTYYQSLENYSKNNHEIMRAQENMTCEERLTYSVGKLMNMYSSFEFLPQCNNGKCVFGSHKK